MLKWIKLVLAIAFLAAGFVFVYSCLVNMHPGFLKSQDYYSTQYAYVSDINNPNKGSYVIAYAVLAAGCFIATGLLFHSVKDREA